MTDVIWVNKQDISYKGVITTPVKEAMEERVFTESFASRIDEYIADYFDPSSFYWLMCDFLDGKIDEDKLMEFRNEVEEAVAKELTSEIDGWFEDNYHRVEITE